MPKIIENIRDTLLGEAKHQIITKGYSSTTIRSVASACGVGVGTVYNYFPSKDMLIASFVLEDWRACIAEMEKGTAESATPEDAIRCIYNCITGFISKNTHLFSDSDAMKVFATAFNTRHKLLLEQLTSLLLPVCSVSKAQDKEYLAEFLAENILIYTVRGDGFEKFYSVIKLLFI